MRIAVLSDAHANHISLRACLDRIDRDTAVDTIYFLGDAVGYYSEPNLVIDLLRERNLVCLLGNHDAMALGAIPSNPEQDELYRLSATRDSLSDDNRRFLSTLKPSLETQIDSRQVLFVHGSPFDELTGYVYPDAEFEDFSSLPHDLIFMGHTHHPFLKYLDDKRIVNVGSCGSPRDHGSLASFAIYDTDKDQVEILRLTMDVKRITECFAHKVHGDVIKMLGRAPEKWVGRQVDHV